MNKFLTLVLSFLFYTIGFSQTYSAATYNVRLNIESDGINRWDNRKAWLTEQIKTLSPDMLGTQEGLQEQIAYLDSALSNYEYAGVGREDGVNKGEYTAVFYNNEKFRSIENGTFWLSETPDTVSVGWDAVLERICTYILLFDKTQSRYFWVFNAHLDHLGEQSRLESLKLIWQYIQELNTENYPWLLMGDFNAAPDAPPIKFISKYMADSKAASQTKSTGPEGTFNGFDITHPLDQRIDYIFVSDDIEVHNYSVINEIRNKRTPSDHLPVFINFSINKSEY